MGRVGKRMQLDLQPRVSSVAVGELDRYMNNSPFHSVSSALGKPNICKCEISLYAHTHTQICLKYTQIPTNMQCFTHMPEVCSHKLEIY